jgi:hypothetical protein
MDPPRPPRAALGPQAHTHAAGTYGCAPGSLGLPSEAPGQRARAARSRSAFLRSCLSTSMPPQHPRTSRHGAALQAEGQYAERAEHAAVPAHLDGHKVLDLESGHGLDLQPAGAGGQGGWINETAGQGRAGEGPGRCGCVHEQMIFSQSPPDLLPPATRCARQVPHRYTGMAAKLAAPHSDAHRSGASSARPLPMTLRNEWASAPLQA